MIEKWKTAIDNGGVFAALLTDLSKAFDCIPHDLIIAKLAAYGFDTNALKLIHNYLSNRIWKWKDIFYGVPQGSILGPLLFNIHLCDLFYFLENTDIASYADDNTLYSAQKNRETVINTIETSSQVLFDWFSDNFMKANSGKSHLLMSGTETTHANIDGSMIKSSQKEILFDINLDSELKFEDQFRQDQLYALARITPFIDLKQRRNIMKAFFGSQFGYCPIIWMFHSRGLNNKINRIHESALRITYKDKSSIFQELLEKDNSVSIHHRNIQKLAIEIYKVLHGFSPPILNDIFVPVSRPYNFRRNDTLQRRRVNSVRHGTESISFLGPKIWDLVSSDIELSQSLSIFKRKIKKWVPLQCLCRLCKIYLQHEGFIQ